MEEAIETWKQRMHKRESAMEPVELPLLSTSQHPGFAPFPRLPPEIRDMIWELVGAIIYDFCRSLHRSLRWPTYTEKRFSALRHRNAMAHQLDGIDLEFARNLFSRKYHQQLLLIPLHINREAREVSLEHYAYDLRQFVYRNHPTLGASGYFRGTHYYEQPYPNIRYFERFPDQLVRLRTWQTRWKGTEAPNFFLECICETRYPYVKWVVLLALRRKLKFKRSWLLIY